MLADEALSKGLPSYIKNLSRSAESGDFSGVSPHLRGRMNDIQSEITRRMAGVKNDKRIDTTHNLTVNSVLNEADPQVRAIVTRAAAHQSGRDAARLRATYGKKDPYTKSAKKMGRYFITGKNGDQLPTLTRKKSKKIFRTG